MDRYRERIRKQFMFKMRWFLIVCMLGGAALAYACGNAVKSDSGGSSPAMYTYRIVHAYPHDREAFTQGLVYQEGRLYESTGRRGFSSLREVELETGKVLRIHNLPDRYFGEGIALFAGKIAQLTWQANLGFIYERDSFRQIREFHYPTEGWGITYDGKRLIMSDGSATLFFLDPETLRGTGRLEVRDGGKLVTRLNELEYIRGTIYANVWQTDNIARIDPDTGKVTGWIHCTGLMAYLDLSRPVDVLNGIAYDKENDRLFVTGKLWPKLFEIELVPED